MIFARRTDSNSAEIVKRLREMGVQVFDMSRVAQWIPGFPDALVVVAGAIYLVEFKAAKGAYTEDQVLFHEAWNGPPIHTLRSVEEATGFVVRLRRALLA